MKTRIIVYSALACATYIVLSLAMPIFAFGPIQFRVGIILKCLTMIDPLFAVGFSLGTLIINFQSPFGWHDFLIMPIVDLLAGLAAYRFRKFGWLTMLAHSLIISISVAYFPLYLGGKIPFWPNILWVTISIVTLEMIGYFVLFGRFSVQLSHILPARSASHD